MVSSRATPTRPKAFGNELRRLRESSGLSLHDICVETKISVHLLRALEDGRFSLLPEKVFSQNFVRQYTKTIGYSDERLIAAFDAAWDQFHEVSGSRPLVGVLQPPPRRSIRWGFWFPIGVGGAILLMVGMVILQGSDPGGPLRGDRPHRAAAATSAGISPVTGSPGNIPPVSHASVDHDSFDPVRLTVRVDDNKECWIHYRDRDGVTDQRLLSGGEELELELRGPVKFTVGNAGAVSVIVDGTRYEDLGISGQVIHTELSQEGLVALGVGARHD
jgi:cytoskeletal protein RodZ